MEVRGQKGKRREHFAGMKSRRGPVAPGNNVRIKTFYRLLPHFSAVARRRRMQGLMRMLEIRPGTRVLDLGGSPAIWDNLPVPLDITILNLPGAVPSFQLDDARTSIHTFYYVEGDACNVRQFADCSFDLVFSNSVIEHVGPPEKQEAFAREVLRLGKSYFVQTPSAWFPIEAHTGMPFYWFYPEQLRAWLLRRSQKKLPSWWTEYVAGTRVLSRGRMAELFPDARLHTEFFFGLPKSIVAYSPERFPVLGARHGGKSRRKVPSFVSPSATQSGTNGVPLS
jgi:SAM-dependent methyltransferase